MSADALLPIEPGRGVGPFLLGMLREEIWALTDSDIVAYYKGSANERSDELVMHAVHVHYANGRAVEVGAFVSTRGRTPRRLVIGGVDLTRARRDDVMAFLELQGVAVVDDVSVIVAPTLGLHFVLVDRGDFDELDSISVVAPRPAPAPADPPGA